MLGYLRQREMHPTGAEPWIHCGYGRSRSINLVALPPRCFDMSCFGSPFICTQETPNVPLGIFNMSY